MIEQAVAAATSDKKLAQAARKEGKYRRAIELIERAIAALEVHRSVLDSTSTAGVSAEVVDLAEKLADAYGSSGGIYRSAAQYAKSVAAYDKGFLIEADPRFGLVSSYNLTQRLVARVLYRPDKWNRPGTVVTGERFPDCLNTACDVVIGQTSGKRENDPWAWADQGMLLVLLQRPASSAWDKVVALAKKSKQTYVFDSTRNVLTDLLTRIDKVSAPDAGLAQVADGIRNADSRLARATSEIT